MWYFLTKGGHSRGSPGWERHQCIHPFGCSLSSFGTTAPRSQCHLGNDSSPVRLGEPLEKVVERPILSSPTFERNSLLTSTKQGPEEVHMTSVWEAPLQTHKASRQLRVYSINSFPMKVSLEMGCCATQTRLPFTTWKSYIHNMVVLCTPSQDTWSMMYSVPSRYSCNRIPHPWAPHQRLDFLKNSKWSRAWLQSL